MWADGAQHPTVWGIPNASERGTKSEMGPPVGGLATSPLLSTLYDTMQVGCMGAHWLHHPCHLGSPQSRSGHTCDRIGYVTLAVWGVEAQ